MRFHTVKAQTIDSGQSQPISNRVRRSLFNKSASHGNLGALTQVLFKIINYKEKQDDTNEKQTVIHTSTNGENAADRKLEDLENCANAARQTEAFDQYK